MSPLRALGTPAPCRTTYLDLATAVLADGEVDDLLELLIEGALSLAHAQTVAIVLPGAEGGWILELVRGERAAALLGIALPAASPLAAALAHQDPHAIDAISAIELEGTAFAAICEPIQVGEGFHGALIALIAQEPGQVIPAAEHPHYAEDRARLEALAVLIALVLREGESDGERELQDERTRIARDLHDLAIQELFAVGMELEALTAALQMPGSTATDAGIRRSVESSVQGVERAVAQIRQVVQSLRRDRSAATLSERLRHEAGLATAGLGFVPALRLPPDPAAMDAEIPDEIAEDVVAVVRESLANAARHAHATAVAVAVAVFSEGVDRVVQVAVSDNGRGIDPSITRRSGLANMSSRARRHQGWVDAISLEPGTMISWRVTLPPTD